MKNSACDVIVVGGGPAGLAAAIMVRRSGLYPVILERSDTGGTLRTARWVENYPGFPDGIEGWDLARRIVEQADRFDVPAYREEVSLVVPEAGSFKVVTDKGEHRARAVVAAYGAAWRSLGVPGEDKVKGIRSFNTVAELEAVAGKDLSGKKVLVVGGGDVAADQSLGLADRGARVTMLVRGDKLGAADHLCHQVKRSRSIDVVLEASIRAMDLSTSSLLVEIVDMGRAYQETADAALVCVGRYCDTSLLPAGTGDPVLADAWGRCPVQGIFLAGDLRRGPDRHTAIAVGDGQAAGLAAVDYVRNVEREE